jgi:hypothetical protein
MKLKALDDDIKLGRGGYSCERVNLSGQVHDRVVVFLVFFRDTVIGSHYVLVYWLVNYGLKGC